METSALTARENENGEEPQKDGAAKEQEDAGEGTFLIVGLTQGTYTGGMDIYLTMEGLNLRLT